MVNASVRRSHRKGGGQGGGADMRAKHSHCTPSCATPRSPAVHSNVSSSLQHAMASRDPGTVSMFAKPAVADVVPRRTK